MLMSQVLDAKGSHNIEIDKFFEGVKQFKHLGTTQRIKIQLRRKLRSDLSPGILAIIRYRILCLPVCYPKM